MMFNKILTILAVIAVRCLHCVLEANTEPESWPFEIEVQHRPGTYWWCPGSAWDKEDIDWNLRKLKEGGISTVHIIPIYGAKGYEDHYIIYLSDEWVEKLQYILKKADSMGMQVDMTTGTGWCFGGPDLTKDHWAIKASMDRKTGKLKFESGRMVKRSAPGGEGHMLNPYSPGAVMSYLKRFDDALAECELLPRAQYHDSFEYGANWCPEMLDEFKKRRGYELRAHLKTLFGKDENADRASRIKYDYRLTVAELHREYIQTWAPASL